MKEIVHTADAQWSELPLGDGYFRPTCEAGFIAVVDRSGGERVVMKPLTGEMRSLAAATTAPTTVVSIVLNP